MSFKPVVMFQPGWLQHLGQFCCLGRLHHVGHWCYFYWLSTRLVATFGSVLLFLPVTSYGLFVKFELIVSFGLVATFGPVTSCRSFVSIFYVSFYDYT